MTNPFITNRKIFLVYSFIWSLIITFQIVGLHFLLNINLEYAITDAAIFGVLYFLLGLSLWYSASAISIEGKDFLNFIITHLFAALIISAIWCATGYLGLLILTDLNMLFFNSSLLWRFITGVLLYFILISINYAFIYYGNLQEAQLNQSRLKSLYKESELKLLRYQINPHFIYNSLNSISSLILTNPKLAHKMIINFSDFFRSTLSQNKTKLSKFSEELKLIKIYLEIEKIRFEERFEYLETIEPECLNQLIPSMILQPLIENTLKHGVYESLQKINIELNSFCENDFLIISIKNNYEEENFSGRGEQIGLQNIKSRLKLIYGTGNLLTVKKENNIFEVKLFIPINKGN